MPKPKRIFVTVTKEQLVAIQKLMGQENRSQAFIATMIFNDGFRLVGKPELDFPTIGNESALKISQARDEQTKA